MKSTYENISGKAEYYIYYLECCIEENLRHQANLKEKRLKSPGEVDLIKMLETTLPESLRKYETSCEKDYQRFLTFISKDKELVNLFQQRGIPTITPSEDPLK